MFRTKQEIGMVATLGLALVLATTTAFATTQSAHAQACPFECGHGTNPGASASGQNSQVNQNQDSQGNTVGSTPIGQAFIATQPGFFKYHQDG